MINIKIDIEGYNTDEIAREIEHVSQLISQGYHEGVGWELTGKAEKEPDTVVVDDEEEDDREEPLDMGENERANT